MSTPSCSLPGRTMSTPAKSFAVQMKGNRNFVAKTAVTKACASGSGYPVAMIEASAQ